MNATACGCIIDVDDGFVSSCERHLRGAGAPTVDEWTIEVPWTAPRLLANTVRKLDYREWASLTKSTRAWARVAALHAKVRRPLTLIEIEIEPHLARRHGREQDVASCAPAAKAAIDGLVDGKIVGDDSPTFVRKVTFLPTVFGAGDFLAVRIKAVL